MGTAPQTLAAIPYPSHNFAELKVGDYVVHENHGLGIYKGIEKVEVEKVVKDYIKIEYSYP